MTISRPARWFANLPSSPEFNVLVFSFLINLAWELWQVSFFQGMAEQPHGAGREGLYAGNLRRYGHRAGRVLGHGFHRRDQKLDYATEQVGYRNLYCVGLVATIIFEALATGALERWVYNDAMPRLPIVGTGLLPVIQWLVIPPLVIWFVRRPIGTRFPG